MSETTRVERIKEEWATLQVDIYGRDMRCRICGVSVDNGHNLDCPASEGNLDVPWLLSEIDRLRRERDRLREAYPDDEVTLTPLYDAPQTEEPRDDG